MKRLAVVLGLLGIMTTAVAQDCRNPRTQVDMNRCSALELEAATKEINRVYNEYRARLSEAQRNQIREVQLAWIGFRDLACKFEASGARGGTANSMVLSSCLTRMTKARTQELKALGNCQEGDVSCPAWK